MTDDATAAARQNWDTAAAGWERNADQIMRTSKEVTQWLVDKLDPQPGETFLELAAGPGDTGFEIARRVGPEGRLISTDLAPRMVEAAKRRASAAGIANAEFREMDAQRIDLPDDSVDGVVHRFGPMLLPDPAASARDVRRVLKDGGRYATSSWGTTERNPVFPRMARAIAELGHISPPPPDFDATSPGAMASMSDPAKVRSLLTDAGFTDITIEEVVPEWVLHGFDDLWIMPSELAGFGQIIKGLDDQEMERAKDAVRKACEPFRDGDDYRIPAVAVCFLAR